MFEWLTHWKNLGVFKLARAMQKQNEQMLDNYEKLLASQQEKINQLNRQLDRANLALLSLEEDLCEKGYNKTIHIYALD